VKRYLAIVRHNPARQVGEIRWSGGHWPHRLDQRPAWTDLSARERRHYSDNWCFTLAHKWWRIEILCYTNAVKWL